MQRSSSARDKSHESSENSQIWTASRCHRLLRQLQSKLSHLQGLTAELNLVSTALPKRRHTTHGDEAHRTSKRVRYTYSSRRRSYSTLCATQPCRTPPRLLRTFGSMKLDNMSPPPSHVVLPTPLIRKFRYEPETPRDPSNKPENKSAIIEDSTPSLKLEYDQNDKSPRDRRRTYEAILEWVAGLLRATAFDGTEPHPKSLLGICLRKVPACVAEIEEWESQMAKANGSGFTWTSRGATLDMYQQLEDFGVKGLGWQPLKMVIRSHAAFLLSDAITRGFIEPYVAKHLIRLFLKFGCIDDGGKIATAVAELAIPTYTTFNSTDDTKGAHQLISILKRMAAEGLQGIVLEKFEELAVSERIPLAWLTGSGTDNPWLVSFRAVTSAGKAAVSGMDFLSTSLALLATSTVVEDPALGQEACEVERNLTSIAGAIVAAAMSLGPGDTWRLDQAGLESRERRLRRLTRVLEQSLAKVRESMVGRKGRKRQAQGLPVLTLAHRLAVSSSSELEHVHLRPQADADADEDAGRDGLWNWSWDSVQVRLTTSLAYWVAHYRSRSMGIPNRNSTGDVVDRLALLGLPERFQAGLRAEVAFLLAQTTKDLGDLAFAESLFASHQGTERTTFAGWTWDQSISEWVQMERKTSVQTTAQGGTIKSRQGIHGDRKLRSSGPIEASRRQEALSVDKSRKPPQKQQDSARQVIDVLRTRQPNAERISRRHPAQGESVLGSQSSLKTDRENTKPNGPDLGWQSGNKKLDYAPATSRHATRRSWRHSTSRLVSRTVCLVGDEWDDVDELS